jgi:hypothetical protein
MYGAAGSRTLEVEKWHGHTTPGVRMTTLLISLDLDPGRSEEVVRLLRTEMAPWMRHQPGFVSSHWLLADDHRHCTVTVEFDDDGHARDVAAATLALPDNPARSWHVGRVEVVADLGLAPRPGVV